MIVIPILITSCQVSEKWEVGPVNIHIKIDNAIMKTSVVR